MNYSFLIGVEKYLSDNIEDLNYIQNDVTELSEAIENINYKRENGHIYLNEHATKTWIESQLRQLTSLLDKEADSIIFYFAGHGIYYEGINYLLCYDTDKDNIPNTAIQINDIFDLLGKHCNKVILLLDSCHSGLKFDGLSRNISSSISDDIFKQKCKDNEYWVVLSACKEDEESNPIKKYNHGTWTYHLIQCLKGNVISVLDDENNLVISKLQEYLLKQVSTDIREHFKGKKQTPWKFESSLGPVIVGTLETVPAKQFVKEAPTSYNLIYEQTEKDKIKYLSGFKTGYNVPNNISFSTKSFVKRISNEELQNSIDNINSILKDLLGYKRKEIRFELGDGSAEFNTPDFSIEISIDQDETSPSQYIKKIKLTNINTEYILNESFNSAFSDFFDKLIIDIDSSINIENLIDYLEDIDIKVDYPPDATSCSFKIDDMTYYFTDCQIIIKKINATPKDLFLSITDKNETIHKLQDSRYIPLIQEK